MYALNYTRERERERERERDRIKSNLRWDGPVCGPYTTRKGMVWGDTTRVCGLNAMVRNRGQTSRMEWERPEGNALWANDLLPFRLRCGTLFSHSLFWADNLFIDIRI